MCQIDGVTTYPLLLFVAYVEIYALFGGDQTDRKSTCGGPNSISKTWGLQIVVLSSVHFQPSSHFSDIKNWVDCWLSKIFFLVSNHNISCKRCLHLLDSINKILEEILMENNLSESEFGVALKLVKNEIFAF